MAAGSSSTPPCFNPHPASRPGATRRSASPSRPRPRFNPHPASRPGATLPLDLLHRDGHHVSILTRPRGRVLRWAFFRPAAIRSFQSSPGLAAGCYPCIAAQIGCRVMFQSSPGLAAGCYPAQGLAHLEE
ncbi:hypothetical protein STH317 [Symbiobacterium thermophilum IAM 14863]|uniref:Uncharacterized protein n=1 Tax=Symbiobacterium thermophilum (strain DSM 24528 / JCM 14929 / IAM 14863 / T) TaxID=292459 RepID=Q67SP1_SYMTH|nr:hypothetical protein STH317 [Symbiobacterium thermophilum IAM 14863]